MPRMTAMERKLRHIKDTPMRTGQASMEAAVSIVGPFCHSLPVEKRASRSRTRAGLPDANDESLSLKAITNDDSLGA
jgi:hypothetical protein